MLEVGQPVGRVYVSHDDAGGRGVPVAPPPDSGELSSSGAGAHVLRRQSTLDLVSLQTPTEEARFHEARGHRLGHIAREMRRHDGGVSVQTRLRGIRQYDSCFVGSEAVDWLIGHRYAQTRVEAVMLGNDLMDAGHFHHVSDKTDNVERRYKYAFRDSPDEYYRFYVHEAGQPNQLKKRIEMREKLRQRHRRTKSTDAPSLHDSDQPLYSVPTSNLSPTSNLDSSARSKGGEGLRWSSNDEPTGSLPSRMKKKVQQVVGGKLRAPWTEVACPVLEGQTPEDIEKLVWGFQKVDDTPHDVMELLSTINTLHKGDPTRATGNTYMMGMDGTEASKRGFQLLVSHILKPSDFVYLVAIRERKLPDRLAVQSRNSDERLRWQFDLWRVARKILRPAHKELLARQIEHSVFTPKSSDARKKMLRLARQYQVQTIVLGKHRKGEAGPLAGVQGHFRKMTAYVAKHAPKDAVQLLVLS